MTKQEQIKEITQIICRRSKDNICLIDKNPCNCNCGWARYAEVIYNADCRKAVEVRKETAKEFVETLKEKLQKYIWHNNIPECMFNQVIDELLKEYEK